MSHVFLKTLAASAILGGLSVTAIPSASAGGVKQCVLVCVNYVAGETKCYAWKEQCETAAEFFHDVVMSSAGYLIKKDPPKGNVPPTVSLAPKTFNSASFASAGVVGADPCGPLGCARHLGRH